MNAGSGDPAREKILGRVRDALARSGAARDEAAARMNAEAYVAAHGQGRGRPVEVLAQLNVSGEETKGGYQPSMFEQEAGRLRGLSGIVVRGVMTMAPFDATEATLRSVFAGARRCAEMLRAAGHPASQLSMGMSGDYQVAVEEGATLVRLGTVLFGARAT